MTAARTITPMPAPAPAPARDVVRPAPGRDIPDGELVGRAVGGDRWAEEALFRRHAPAIAATVMRLLGDRAEAEDVVQDTFVTALQKLPTLRDPASVRGWLLAIAVRDVQQRFRRRRLKRFLGLERGEACAEVTCLAYAAEGLRPDLRAELGLLDRALGELAPRHRVAWMLRNVDGLSLEETAAACGCSLATVKRRIATAEKRVRAHVAIADEQEGRDG